MKTLNKAAAFAGLLMIFTPLGHSEETAEELSLADILELTVETASRQKQTLTDAPSIISVMTKKEIQRFQATSLIDLLKYIPGIETSMGPTGEYRVSIRGVRKDGNILFLINGQPTNFIYDGRAIFDLPTGFIEKIEVIRGPGSPLYGTNAVAGIIQIFTTKNAKSIRLGGGTQATYLADANYSGRLSDKDQISLSAGYTRSNGANVNPFSDGSEPGKTNRFVRDFYVNGQYDRDRFNLSFWGFKRNRGPYVGPEYLLTPDSEYKFTQLSIDSSYRFSPSEKWTVTPKIYVGTNWRDSMIEEFPIGYYPSFTGAAFTHEKLTGAKLGTEIQGNYSINEKWNFLNGVVFEKQFMPVYDVTRNYKISGMVYEDVFANYDNVALDQRGKTRSLLAYFADGIYNTALFTGSAGLRFDRYSDFGSSLNPRAALVLKPKDFVSFKILYGQAFRAPTFKELYDRTNLGPDGIVGNPDLKAETSRSTEFGTEVKFSRTILRGNVYYNHTSNLISIYDPDGTGGYGSFKNIGTLKNIGFEVESILKVHQNLNLMANFSQFTMTFDWDPATASAAELNYIENTGDHYVTNAPATRANFGLDLNFSKMKFFVGLNYGGKSEANRRSAIEGLRSVHIPRYFQTNFKVTYEPIKDWSVEFSGTSIPVGGNKYSDPEESTGISEMGPNGMRQPGPLYVLSTTYAF